MAEEKKDEGAGGPLKMLPEESLERYRDAMMDKFSQFLWRLPRGDASSSGSHSRGATPFKVQVNFVIPIFKGLIDADGVDKNLNLLEAYFSGHDISNREMIAFALLKSAPRVKD